MSWKDEAAREIRMAEEASAIGNAGKVRTCARRAVGIVASRLQAVDGSYQLGTDFIRQIRGIAEDKRFSEESRSAADRLQTRLTKEFVSASSDPIGDAHIIIQELMELIDRS